MKTTQLIIAGLFVLTLQGCGLDAIENPNVTEDKFVKTPQATATWVNGARTEMASSLSVIVELTELTSDNYFNNRTLSSKVFDIPQIVYTDVDVNRLQTAVHNLRRTAEFGLETVIPQDNSATTEQRAELYFYLGVSHLFAGEYFVGLPEEAYGPALEPEAHFTKAIDAFDEVAILSNDMDLVQAANLAKARISFYQGDLSTLRTRAESVINTAPALNYQVQYDGINGPSNGFQTFLYNSSQDEFAPLPRLDFLDPKYYSEDGSGQDQKSISLFKVEEAYLLLAEAELTEGDLPGTRTLLKDLLTDVIANRPVALIDDSRETRSGGNRDDYPLSDTVQVRFAPGAPAFSGFILDRQDGPIQVPVVSGTSVTAQDIDNTTTEDELLELIYLMRQEIFISEGRRVVDLGIRYPVSEQEMTGNNNIDSNSPYLLAQIPDFIPLNMQMDDFTVNEEQGIVTIAVNMNRILVQNKTDDSVLPLW